jgi:hypothetical protein
MNNGLYKLGIADFVGYISLSALTTINEALRSSIEKVNRICFRGRAVRRAEYTPQPR